MKEDLDPKPYHLYPAPKPRPHADYKAGNRDLYSALKRTF